MALLLALLLLSPSHAFIPLTHTSPLKIALLVEPTPFNYISGYANRFKEMLKFLHQANDQVQIITADSDKNAPDNFMGFPIITNRGFTFPWYKSVILSLDFAGSLKTIALRFKPDIIHVAAPGMLVFPAIACAKSLDIPLVMSYHTNVFEYTKAYFKFPGNIFTAKQVLYHTLSKADLLLTTSPQLKRDLEEIGLTKIDVWQKGINAERFSPSFRTDEMRNLLSANNPDSPLLVYVGRLGLEKKIEKLRAVLDANPSARLAVVGDGPERKELERVFAGYPVVFAGVMVGDALSSAFASADVFVMPSDTETLGFVVLEAMASGIPVVGVGAAGLLDLIESGNTGFLVSNTDGMAEFSSRVKELIDNTELRAQFGANARVWAEGWSWEAATSKLRNVQYRLAIENFRKRKQETRDLEVERLLDKFADLYRPDFSS